MWFFYVLISILCFAAIELLYKTYVEINQKIAANSLSVLTNLWIAGLSLIVLILFKIPIVSPSLPVGAIIINALLYVLASGIYYESYKHIPASIATILGMSSAIVSTVLGIQFFGESTNIMKFIGLGLIMLSVVILYWEKSRINVKYYLFALAAGSLFGCAYMLDKYIITVAHVDIWQFLFISVCFAIPMKLMINIRTFFTSVNSLTMKSHVFAIYIGACNVTAYYCVYRAYQLGGEVGKIDALNNISIFAIILGEFYLFHDRTNLRNKIIAASICVVGAVMLK